MADEYQVVVLVLSDGREVTYTGPVQVREEDGARVVGVKVTPPRPLGESVYWGSPDGCTEKL